MKYVIIAVAGFAAIHVFDFVSLKNIPLLKPVLWLAGVGALIYAIVGIMLDSQKYYIPSWTSWLGWVLLSVSISLLVYSLFINLGFRRTYISTGVGDVLIKTGTYALVRHPGVLWFILAMISVSIISRSKLFFVAAPLLIVIDIALVIVQDRIVFVRMFTGYRQYQDETPMILPNRNSIKKFLTEIKRSNKT